MRSFQVTPYGKAEKRADPSYGRRCSPTDERPLWTISKSNYLSPTVRYWDGRS